MADALLELHGVSRAYRSAAGEVVVLKDVSLRIAAGEFIAIIGPSGSGKSTLMNILGCLDRPTEGSYRVHGAATEQMSPDELAHLRREHFGFIFQRYNLMENLSATENVALPAVYAGVEADARTTRARLLLETLGLGERTANRPSQLSGGQQQRVSIARSLMNGGAIVLADEPTGALDHASGRQVMAELKRLHAQGHTVILVTHDAATAAHASRVIEIADGRVVSDCGTGDPAVARQAVAPARGTEPGAERRARLDATREAARMAVRSMLAHRLRTLLTMLGIIIGVAAVVTVVALGKGARAQVESQINELGASTLEIFPGADFGDPRSAEIETLVVDDADHLAALSYVDSVSPNLSSSVAALQGNRRANTQVLGVGADLPRVRGLRLKAGRFFTDAEVEAHRAVAVLDQKAAKALFNGNPIGGTVLLGGMPVDVIGVVGASAFAGGATPTVYVPYTSAASRLLGSQRLESITVRVRDDVPTRAAEASLGAELQRLHGRRDFFIYNSDQIRKAVMKSSQTMAALVSAIAAVALVVGGVGVMNIMLVSVKERVREIGVRLAVGARQGDILRQFLIEAVLICLFGGVLGVLSALGVGALSSLLSLGVPFLFTPGPVLAALACSSAIGLGFGYFPARNAAQLDPIQALAAE
ncbi:MacB family efflux pump subunit [Stenotrophomonas maltophilia]|uniref:MacB family efflux pump subunit n=2 Tax=Stenotrophomonas maltophilia TaxID=40324 RepID=UPI0004EF59C8|nr:MacB family efflux pump subunit [Stenotrophomonas maltophilia]AIL07516.1 macrolide export ATP-binding/permease protein MacB [Stenotrophomonas maltophilia]OOD09699.1 MacB family efflux pump subunit [Stenotrophomonas maltophilia]QQA84996.1 MacB family efflux pump subunit [Stenotrophomonas maltophilia]WQE21859.1 MacB family efflux pump subunit [Stenotrophomonas maltophilia]SNW10438.1 macrolide export ATP-binding/permease MacB [Stenotrophomonas maltophilia]